jgi:hypothetical protein
MLETRIHKRRKTKGKAILQQHKALVLTSKAETSTAPIIPNE